MRIIGCKGEEDLRASKILFTEPMNRGREERNRKIPVILGRRRIELLNRNEIPKLLSILSQKYLKKKNETFSSVKVSTLTL